MYTRDILKYKPVLDNIINYIGGHGTDVMKQNIDVDGYGVPLGVLKLITAEYILLITSLSTKWT